MRSSFIALLIVLTFSPVGAQEPLGYAEIKVAETFATRSAPDVAMDPLGRVGMIWLDGETNFLLLQRWDSAGQPDGGPHGIYVSAGGFGPRIGFDDAGRATVIWTSESEMSIKGQRFAADGQLNATFPIATFTAPPTERAALAVAADGTFLVVWSEPETSDAIYARRFAADGAPLGTVVTVDTSSSHRLGAADVVLRDNGEFAVSWRQLSVSSRAFIRFFDAQDRAVGDAINFGTGDVGLTAAGGEVVVAYAHQQSVMAQRFSWSGVPLGSAISVSPAAGFEQHRPTLARASTGALLVIWERTRRFSGLSNGSTRLWGRWLDADGTPRGAAFWMSPGRASAIRASAAAADGLGNVVVAHLTSAIGPPWGYLFARRLAADRRAGTLQLLAPTKEQFEGDTRAAFTVVRSGGSAGTVTVRHRFAGGSATPNADYLRQEGVITFDDGETGAKNIAGVVREDTELDADETVVLTLSDATGGAELVAPSTTTLTLIDNDFAATPHLQPASSLPPFQLNMASADLHRSPAAATHASGIHAVTWIARDPFTNIPTVYARRFDRQGQPLEAPLTIGEAVVNAYIADDRPTLAFDATGGFLVVWGVDTFWGRYVDAAGRLQGEAFEILASLFPYHPIVTAIGDDTFAVVWSDQGSFLTPSSVTFRLIGRQGEERSELIDAAVQAFDGNVAAYADGSFIILWKSAEVGLQAQRFDAAGERLGAPIVLAMNTSEPFLSPAVATATGERALVVYQTGGPFSDIYGQRLDGDLAGEPFLISVASGRQEKPSVAVDVEGNAIVAWESHGQEGSGSGLYARRISATGQALGRELRLMATQRGNQREVALTAGPRGEALAVWEGASPSGEVDIFGRLLPLGRCGADARTLCLGGDRFRVEVEWEDFAGSQGHGQAVDLTADTGAFWFFDENNLELVVKVLDGTANNEHHWVFYGALSNVTFDLTVTDLETGAMARYNNPLGNFASVGDITALPALGTPATASAAQPEPKRLLDTGAFASFPALPGKGSCVPDTTTLCLGDGRFAVTALLTDPTLIRAQARLQTDDTGTFWFFDEDNIELIIKVLDGTAANGHHWVFYGALSNTGFTVTITDTVTGIAKTYDNPSGNFASVGDTMALPDAGQ